MKSRFRAIKIVFSSDDLLTLVVTLSSLNKAVNEARLGLGAAYSISVA
jgi:hypothetical protein